MEEKDYSNVYSIPANYTDSGKLFGGMLAPRNAIEALILVVIVGYPELMLIPMPTTIRVVVMVLTLIPLMIIIYLIAGILLMKALFDLRRSIALDSDSYSDDEGTDVNAEEI